MVPSTTANTRVDGALSRQGERHVLGRGAYLVSADLPTDATRRLADRMQAGAFTWLLLAVVQERILQLELIQRPGDLIIVPSGWWHVVLNLDKTVAVTQNYASKTNVLKVWRECCEKRPDFAMYWLRALKAHRREYAELCGKECYPADEGIET